MMRPEAGRWREHGFYRQSAYTGYIRLVRSDDVFAAIRCFSWPDPTQQDAMRCFGGTGFSREEADLVTLNFCSVTPDAVPANAGPTHPSGNRLELLPALRTPMQHKVTH